MNKNTLVILNFGLLLIVLSNFGPDMEINYLTLVSGLAVAGIGAVRLFLNKKRKQAQ